MRALALAPELVLVLGAALLFASAVLGGASRISSQLVLGVTGTLAMAAAGVTSGLSDDFLFATYRVDLLSQAAKACVGVGLLLAASRKEDWPDQGELALFLALAALALCAAASTLDLVAQLAEVAAALVSLLVAAALAPDVGGIRRPMRRLMGAAAAPICMIAVGTVLLVGATGDDSLPLVSEALVDFGPGAAAVAGAVFLLGGYLYLAGAVPWFAPLPLMLRDEWTPLALFAGTGGLVSVMMVLTRLAAALGPLGARVGLLLAVAASVAAVGGAFRAANRADFRCALAHALCAQAGILILGLVPATSAGAASTLAATLVVVAANATAILLLAARPYGARALALEDLRGLGRREPLAGAALATALLAITALPPTAGFVSRWRLVDAAWREGWLVASVAVLASSVALFAAGAFALAVLYSGRNATEARTGLRRDPTTIAAVLLAFLLIASGLVPGPLFRAADAAASLLP